MRWNAKVQNTCRACEFLSQACSPAGNATYELRSARYPDIDAQPMNTPNLRINVECYTDHRSEDTPRRFFLGARVIEVVDVQDRWLDPKHRYFKVQGDDGNVYILRYDVGSDRWELTFFDRSTTPNGDQ